MEIRVFSHFILPPAVDTGNNFFVQKLYLLKIEYVQNKLTYIKFCFGSLDSVFFLQFFSFAF